MSDLIKEGDDLISQQSSENDALLSHGSYCDAVEDSLSTNPTPPHHHDHQRKEDGLGGEKNDDAFLEDDEDTSRATERTGNLSAYTSDRAPHNISLIPGIDASTAAFADLKSLGTISVNKNVNHSNTQTFKMD